MITPVITVEQRSLLELDANITKLVNLTGRSLKSAVTQVSLLTIKSAIVATKPGTAATVKGMGVKQKFRRAEKMPPSENWYEYTTSDGEVKMFKAKAKLSKDKGRKRVTKGVKVWHKKNNRWVWTPWMGKADRSKSLFRIPHYGAAKAGWLNAYKAFGKVVTETDKKARKRKTRVTYSNGAQGDALITIENLVTYAKKISPLSGVVAMRSAARQMPYIIKREVDKIEAKGKL